MGIEPKNPTKSHRYSILRPIPEQGRTEKPLADSGRAFDSSLWDARIPAWARKSNAFGRCVVESCSGSVDARGRKYDVVFTVLPTVSQTHWT